MAEGRPPTATDPASTRSGPGLVLVVVYAVLALAATGRSVLQVLTVFGQAPLSYALSAMAAVVYLVATVALYRRGTTSTRVAVAAVSFELVGVLLVGLASYVWPATFHHKTVWSHFGQGYGFVPLVLPFVGLWWLRRVRRGSTA